MRGGKVSVCFEVSFEAGNKVGGIYTVLRSKSRFMKGLYGERYFSIGFYNKKSALSDFVEKKPPEGFLEVFESLKPLGINCYFGSWVTASGVNLILVESSQYREMKIDVNGGSVRNIDDIKKFLWENFAVDSLREGFEFDEPVAWSFAVGKLIEKLLPLFKNEKVVAHFHEWLSGPGLLYLKSKNAPCRLVFTTHATRLGRALSNSGVDLNPSVLLELKSKAQELASSLFVRGPHDLEVACANNSVFTTVSEVVAIEASCLIGKTPDLILPNALDFSEYPTMEKLVAKRRKQRALMKEFLKAYFASYYDIDTRDCVIFYTLGRYEFRNKGIDLFIKALGRLNERLRNSPGANPVFTFIFVPKGNDGVKEEVMENVLAFDRIRALIDEEMGEVRTSLIMNALSGGDLKSANILGEDFIHELSVAGRSFVNSRAGRNAPLCAVDLDEGNDEIIQALRGAGLNNSKDDFVKVIFYPNYLSRADPLLGMDVQDAVMGSTLGVFPSRYEPWGLTVIEAGALMNMAVTTTYSGVGRFVLSNTDQSKRPGIRVLDIESDIVSGLTDIMNEVVFMDKDELLMKMSDARQIAELSDWVIQIKNYEKAHNFEEKSK